MTRRPILAALVALCAAPAFAIEPPRVFVACELQAGTRSVRGISRELEWLFAPLDADRAYMRLRVPVESFASGDRAFDDAFHKAIGGQRHSFVQIEGVAWQGRLEGTLDLAGTVREVSVQLHSERAGGNVVAVGSFTVDLRDYGVLLAGVDPRVSFDFSVRLVASADAVLASGYVAPVD